MNNLIKKIRQIIKEEMDLQADFGDSDKARRGIIALSKGLIPNKDLKVIDFQFGSIEPEETGSYDQEGEIDIKYVFEGTVFKVNIYASGEFYYTYNDASFKGSYDSPPDPGEEEIEPENIYYDEDEIEVIDDQGNKFEFNVSDLTPTFKKDLGRFLFDYYDPS